MPAPFTASSSSNSMATQPATTTRRSAATASHRGDQLAQIHIARKALIAAGVFRSVDEYRDLLAGLFNGRNSSADLNDAERLQLLHHFQRLGWKGTVGGSRANPATGRKPAPWSPKLKKLWSLWQQLADKGLVTDRTSKGLSKWCFRQTAGPGGRGGVDRVEFLNPAQLQGCTEAAKLWLERGTEARPGSASIHAGSMAQAERRLEDANRGSAAAGEGQP
jgi:hypothetical protein